MLLLACLALFQQVHKTAMLHAPGRLVPAVLAHLRDSGLLPEATVHALTGLQTAVIDAAKGGAVDAAAVAQLVESVRRIALADPAAASATTDP